MNKQELLDLTRQWLDGTIGSEDRQRLQDWYQAGSDEARELRISAIAPNENEDALRSRILQNIRQSAAMDTPAPATRSPVRRLLRRTLTAAAIVLIMATGGMAVWLSVHGRKGDTQGLTHRVTAPALAPGGKRAILTLSDGTTITLDSARDGMLGRQGNTQIVKLSGGHLAYQAAAAGKVPEEKDASLRYNNYNTITTPRGGEYQVKLPDSSIVWLNSASSLKFPVRFAADSRKVILTGEAYFEISRNAKAPFIVEVDGMRVEVLGTSFDVMAYTDEDVIRTAVAAGSVRASMGKDAPLVYPNQQASFPRKGGTASVGCADMEEVLAWKEGKFRFHRTDIRTIMRQIARWYNVEIDYRGDLSGVRLYGTMSRKESASQMFELLEQTGRVRFSTEGDRVAVMPVAP